MSTGSWTQEDRNRWARVSDRAAQECEAEGDHDTAKLHRMEAASWRAGKPRDFVPRESGG